MSSWRFPLLHPPVLNIVERMPRKEPELKTVALQPLLDPPGPKPIVRGDCLSGGFNENRPCQWSSCRYHLSGEKASCALDVADEGEHSLEEVMEYMADDVSRERIRQIEATALRKLKENGSLLEYKKD